MIIIVIKSKKKKSKIHKKTYFINLSRTISHRRD